MQHAEAISPIQAAPGFDGSGQGAVAPASAFGSGGNALEAEPRAPALVATPFVREMPKVGRNEMCPCGSGKKYKHCHGALQQASGG
jgi:preprotein translocase subunit SecA